MTLVTLESINDKLFIGRFLTKFFLSGTQIYNQNKNSPRNPYPAFDRLRPNTKTDKNQGPLCCARENRLGGQVLRPVSGNPFEAGEFECQRPHHRRLHTAERIFSWVKKRFYIKVIVPV